MDKAAVIPAHFPCDLTDCFDEGLALYIADSAAYFGNYHVCIGGFADIVYMPRANHPNRPVIVVELKWDKSAEAAIAQISKKQYPESLKDYAGEMLLVGIDYDKKTKEHTCVIERFC